MVSRLSSITPLNAEGSALPFLVAVNPTFLYSTLPSRDIMRKSCSFFFSVAIVTPPLLG